MKRSTRILAVIVLLLGFLALSQSMIAQNVKLEGKTFVQQASVGDSIQTGFYFQDSQGNKYPVYLSSKNKAYAWVKSKKTGKMYKRYLPKVTEELNRLNNGKYSK